MPITQADKREAMAVHDMVAEREITERWHADASLRRMHGVVTANRLDTRYQARLARLITAEIRCRRDQAGASWKLNVPEPEDKVTRILAKKGITQECRMSVPQP